MQECDIKKNLYFKWYQLVHGILNPSIFVDHHLIKSEQIHSIEKLKAKELDSLSILLKDAVPAFKKFILTNVFLIYFLIERWLHTFCIVLVNTQLHVFQYKTKQTSSFFLQKYKLIFASFVIWKMNQQFIFLLIVLKVKHKIDTIDIPRAQLIYLELPL